VAGRAGARSTHASARAAGLGRRAHALRRPGHLGSDAHMSSWHGITTVVMGSCGVGFAPVRPAGVVPDRAHGRRRGHPGTALHEASTGGGVIPSTWTRSRGCRA
jgi:hypothetical protein